MSLDSGRLQAGRDGSAGEPDETTVHRTPLGEWLESCGLLLPGESRHNEARLPEIAGQRLLSRRAPASAAQSDESVRSQIVIPPEPATPLRALRPAFDGPVPGVFSDVARHLPAFLYEKDNGRIFVGYQRTTLILRDDSYFRGISVPASPWVTPLLAAAPAAMRIQGTVAVLYANGANMFSHWLFDVLPKFEVLGRAGWGPDQIDFYVVNPVAASFQRETLKALGIPAQKILPAEGLLLEAERLLIPSRLRIGFRTPPWARRFVVGQLGSPDIAPEGDNPKLYISREFARRRRITNNDEVQSLLDRRGYRTVYAERHPVREFARMISGARYIVAPHGAGLANVVFSRPGVNVLEFFGAHVTQEFWLITSEAGGTHHLLAGKDVSGRYPWLSDTFGTMSYAERNTADYQVDVEDLERALNAMEAAAPGMGP